MITVRLIRGNVKLHFSLWMVNTLMSINNKANNGIFFFFGKKLICFEFFNCKMRISTCKRIAKFSILLFEQQSPKWELIITRNNGKYQHFYQYFFFIIGLIYLSIFFYVWFAGRRKCFCRFCVGLWVAFTWSLVVRFG